MEEATMAKCKATEHIWTGWELRWDAKNNKIWVRWCIKCGIEEKSKYAPPPEPKIENIIPWLDLEMAGK